MPNPLIKPGIANQSHREQVDREAIQPEPEHYAGTNLAYRGVQYHGVEPTFTSTPMPEYDDVVDVVYEEMEPQQEPVPVRIVSKSERYQRLARADTRTIPLANVPLQVVGREETRLSLKIVNLDDADAVFVGFAQDMKDWTGSYRLAAGKDVTTTSKEPVWLMTNGAVTDVVVTWIADYELIVDDD